MPEQPDQLCDVAHCARPAVGSYLHLGVVTPAQFAVCEPHLAELKAGLRPSVLAGAEHGGRPVLLLEPATADRPGSTGGAHARPQDVA